MDTKIKEILIMEWTSIIESRSIKTNKESERIAIQNVNDLELILFPYEGFITLNHIDSHN